MAAGGGPQARLATCQLNPKRGRAYPNSLRSFMVPLPRASTKILDSTSSGSALIGQPG